MKFKDRLLYFGFGTGLGCILVYFMLIKDREFPAWLPEDRVLEELSQADIIIPENIVLPFADSLLREAINRSDVIFTESDVRNKPCKEYQLKSDKEKMRMKICGEEVTLLNYQVQ